MTNEAKQLLIDKPELCKEIAEAWEDQGLSWCLFLKEHTAKDWEILTFEYVSRKIIAEKGGGDRYWVGNVSHSLDHMLLVVKLGHVVIKSVLRTSDNVVFDEGKRVAWLNGKYSGRIEGFHVTEDGRMNVLVDRTIIELFNLSITKPLFTTEDGGAVFAGDQYYFVIGDLIYHTCSLGSHDNKKLRFSTREAAENWVKENSPKKPSQVSVMDELRKFYKN